MRKACYHAARFSLNPRDIAAPKARNIKARGKREARRPWIVSPQRRRALKRAKYVANYFGLSGLDRALGYVTRADALRAWPWLSYSAPSALRWTNRIAFGAALDQPNRAFGAATLTLIDQPYRTVVS
jgi:hypothetical protein